MNIETISKLALLLFTATLLSCSLKADKTLQITGTVIDSDTKSILLVKPHQDPRHDSIIEIPVYDGKFSYQAKLQYPEAVYLFLGEMIENGGGRHMALFLENESIALTIYPEEEFDKNSAEGGELNAEYKRFIENRHAEFDSRLQPLSDSIQSLFQKDEFHSKEMKVVIAQLNEAKSHDDQIPLYKEMELLNEKGLDKTAAAKRIEDKQSEIYKEINELEQQYISTHPNLVSYLFLLEKLLWGRETIDINLAKQNCKKLSKAHPNHPLGYWHPYLKKRCASIDMRVFW